jgi:hypothetical protein
MRRAPANSAARRVPDHTRLSRKLQSGAALEVHEQEACLRVRGYVAQGVEHVVTGVVRKGQRVIVQKPDEAGQAATVRGVGVTLRVGAGDEESVRRGDEAPLLAREDPSAARLPGPVLIEPPAVSGSRAWMYF